MNETTAQSTKRRRLHAKDTPAQQFSALRQIRSLTDAQRRQIIGLLNKDQRGRRTCTRKQQKYGEALLEACRDIYLPTVDDAQIKAPCLSVPSMVQGKLDSCEVFRVAFQKAMQGNNNELRMIFYLGEIVAGNPLRADPARKAMIGYVTFLEMDCIRRECMWLTIGLVRHDDMNACQGRCPAVVRAWMECMWEETQSGFPVTIEGNSTLVFISEVILLGDADQLRNASGWKGPNGLKPCLKCMNVVTPGRRLPPGYLTVTDELTDSIPLRQTDLEAIHAHLAEQTVVSRLKQHETLLGWKLAELDNSFLMSPKVSGWCPVESIHYDPMHIYFSNGLVAQQLGLWFSSVQRTNKDCLSALGRYARMWRPMPGSPISCGSAAACVSEKLFKDGSDFKGDAAQCLAALPLCVAFSWEVLVATTDDMVEEIKCLDALHAVCKQVIQCRSHPAQRGELQALQYKHFHLFLRIYGADRCRPKLHYSLHVTGQVERWGKLLDCFCPERKHRNYKQYAANCTRRVDFVSIALLQLAVRELDGTDAGTLHTTLAGKRLCIAGVDKDIFFRLQCAERDFQRGQFLIVNTHHAVEVLGACRHDGCFHLLVKRLSSNQDGLHAFGLSRWKNQDASHEMLPVHMALQTKDSVLFCRKDGQDLWLLG